jgi:hypothetical protein
LFSIGIIAWENIFILTRPVLETLDSFVLVEMRS